MTDKAIEAAAQAMREETFAALTMDECRDATRKAIAAYTAALLPEDVAGLVERLQRHEGIGAALARTDATGRYAEAAMDEAASALTALSARLEEAEQERDDFRSSLATTIGKLMFAQDRIAALERELAEVRGALARLANELELPDRGVLHGIPEALKQARALLAGKETADDGK